MKDHKSRKHSLLSASGAVRWINCPGSVRLEKDLPNQETSYSKEGTKAHELIEKSLKFALENPFLVNNGYLGVSEMDHYVRTFVDFVMEQRSLAQKVTKDPVILLEERLDYSKWAEEGYGTGDVVIIADETLEVIDFKYGMGVRVEAINNPQLRLYGLGALDAYSYLYDIKKIRMTIFQPRLDHISTEELTVDELFSWGDNVVKPAAEIAISMKGDCKAGGHCKFCKAKSVCKVRADYCMAEVTDDFKIPDTLSSEELAGLYGKLKLIVDWAKDVKEYMINQAVKHGVNYPGYKVVEGKSRRKYGDSELVANKLLGEGYNEEEIYKPKEILGITAMTKLLGGAKKCNSLLGDLIILPKGEPTLVKNSDKRQATDSIFEDFKGV